MILIVSATENEILDIKLKFKENKNIKFLVTGVGILRSSFILTEFLYKNNLFFDLIISAGIGGGFEDSDVLINDICIAESEFLADFGVCFDKKIEYFDYNYGHINIKNRFQTKIIKHYPELITGKFITVNSVTARKEMVDFYTKQFNPICESMEGYAIAFVCQKFNIDFMEIRTISNFVGNRENWKANEAIVKLNSFLEDILDNYEIFKI
jgi:futalosine hydrolase